MARGSFVEYSQCANHEFSYRYTCEQCGHVTEWTSAKVAQRALEISKISGFNAHEKVLKAPQIIEKLNKQADEQVDVVIGILKDALMQESYEVVIPNPFVAEMYNEEFSTGASCPKCNCRQTWYPAVYEPVSARISARNYSIGFGIVGMIFSLIYCLLSASNNFNQLLLIGISIVGASVLGFAFGYIKSKRFINAKKKYYDNVPHKHKPEVDWNGK